MMDSNKEEDKEKATNQEQLLRDKIKARQEERRRRDPKSAKYADALEVQADGQQTGSSPKDSTSNRVLVPSASATHKRTQSQNTSGVFIAAPSYHSSSQQARITIVTTPSTRRQSHSKSTVSRSNRGYHNRDYRDRGYHNRDSDYQGGKQRKRERRRMNRETRRTGAPAPPDDRRDSRDPYFYGQNGPNGRPPPAYHRGNPPGWRGNPPGWRDERGPPGRQEYEYGDRSRNHSDNYHRRDRIRERSRSSSRSTFSKSPSSSISHPPSPNPAEPERSRSKSEHESGSKEESRKSRSISQSEGKGNSHAPTGSLSRSHHTSKGSKERSKSPSEHDSEGARGSRSKGGSKERGHSGSRSSRKRRSRGSRDDDRYHSRQRRRRSDSSESDYSSISSSSEDDKASKKTTDVSALTNDQHTVFVTQLVMRTVEKDIRRYFRRKVGCHVNEVILLKDKRTGRHKGCAYVQLSTIEDVQKAVLVSGQAPDFQRFPILVKASEAEKNYIIPASSSTVTAKMMGNATISGPMMNSEGKLIEAQKVYVGSLDPSVSEEHLFALYSQFGQLEKVSMQMEPATRVTRGYAFLSFRDPKEANLAIQTMSNQVLAGRPMKTGWANQSSSVPGVDIVTSDEFPEDASARAQKAYTVLAQLMGTSALPSSSVSVTSNSVSSTAGEAIDAALGVIKDPAAPSSSAVPEAADALAAPLAKMADISASSDSNANTTTAASQAGTTDHGKLIGGAENPTNNILVHNMFDKNEETDIGWEEEIKQEFQEEAGKFGKLKEVVVMSKEEGGMIYASYETVESAQTCASNFAGRWFDKRQLRVDFKQDDEMPSSK
jgi:RNA-binding protein 39